MQSVTRTEPRSAADRNTLATLVGWSAIAGSVLYLASDLVELAQGGFSPTQLGMTYAAEASVPFVVLGLCAVQIPSIGRLGFAAATTYAYTFVFFTGTVLYALVEDVADWDELVARLGGWIDVHSVLMIVAGVVLGVAVARARVLPAWTGATLVAGMLLMAAAAPLPAAAQTAAAGVRDLAFAAMGVALLTRAGRRPA